MPLAHTPDGTTSVTQAAITASHPRTSVPVEPSASYHNTAAHASVAPSSDAVQQPDDDFHFLVTTPSFSSTHTEPSTFFTSDPLKIRKTVPWLCFSS